MFEKIHTGGETPLVDSPSEGEGVPRSTASPTSPRQDPALSNLVTQDRGVHAPDEDLDNPSRGVALNGRHLSAVAWQGRDMQPEVWSSRDARGTPSECRSNGKINQMKKSTILDESTILDNNCNPQGTLSTILDNSNVQLSEANTISLTINSITPTT